MKDPTVKEIYSLCQQHRYNEAIAKTNDLMDVRQDLAVKAHLLVMEHEQNHIQQLTNNPI